MPVAVNTVVVDPFMEYALIIDPETMMTKAIIDTFISFVWTERYIGCGEFILEMPVLPSILSTELKYDVNGEIVKYQSLQLDDYIAIRESDQLMVLETIILKTNLEMGDTIEISGRTLECQLERRVIWGKFEAKSKKVGEGDNAKEEAPVLQDSIKKLLENNVIAPKDERRKIPRIVFEASEDPRVTEIRQELSYMGDNLYTSIYDLCEEHQMGFHVIPNKKLEFVFKLFFGTDHSFEQSENPVVTFSAQYENMLESNYAQSEKGYISNALVRGDDDKVMMEVMRKPERTGLRRREMYIDTGEAPEENEGYTQKYYNRLLEKAKEEMSQHNVTTEFDSEVDWTRQFIFGRDYQVGDIVSVENAYGFGGRCRVSEVVRTRDSSGPTMIPTFVVYESNDIVEKKEGE